MDRDEIVLEYHLDCDYMTVAITAWYVRVMRKVAWKMLSHAKRMERWNVQNIRKAVHTACM